MLAAVVAVALLPVAGCSGTTPAAAPPSPSVSQAPSVAPPSPSPTPSTPPPGPPPVGWALSDIPSFPPAPPPQPIVLPKNGSVPYLSRIPTDQPVAFLTIDDGFTKSPEAPKLLAAANIPVTLFLTTSAIQDNEPYFAKLQEHGAVIEAHTITHTELRGKSYAFQHREICGSADRLGHRYKRRPVLFRPPFGTKDATTLRAAHDCGIKAAFMWKETVHKGKVRYQEEHKVKRGDIILMHFRPAFVKDFLAALRAIHKAGLTPALLEDYIPGSA
ncbi:putative polysaccharide deacetylase [Actinoplanes friuliensis DSM 7358]|jgi:peptidoglycan/xylan/chitin deacetylase (PgdA/CDA1 family)|uniref:Putative polysaccharide deacetylase n=2 Tax=Actinoplanes friuliensis TaxID=196914 RepID=U5W5Y9_9ACTN|nr:putative polysaccharide deacetylase [Actinoplanes friuliensis DSM 7358]